MPGYAIISLTVHGRLASLNTLWSPAGIVLVLRAADALNLSFRFASD